MHNRFSFINPVFNSISPDSGKTEPTFGSGIELHDKIELKNSSWMVSVTEEFEQTFSSAKKEAVRAQTKYEVEFN